MNSVVRRFLTAGLCVGAFGFAGAAAAQGPGETEMVVSLAPGVSIERVCESTATEIVASYPGSRLFLLRVNPFLSGAQGNELLGWNDEWGTFELNDTAQMAHGNTQSFFVRLVPTNYQNQPALGVLGIGPLWTGPDGSGILVAILDTGIAPSESISAAVLPGYNFVEDNADTSDLGLGCDSNGNGEPDEMTGHGTFLAGLVSLVAPHCNILPIKVLDSDGTGSLFSLAAGIRYAADQGATVINLSLSFDHESEIVRLAVEYAQARGVTIVASVGNENSREPRYPAAYPGVLAVAATDLKDHKAPFSNYGSYVSLCAPGTDLVSTMPNGQYGVGEGTSFATAWVSGAAALLQSSAPTLPADRVFNRLRRGISNVPATWFEFPGEMGSGRLSIKMLFTGISKANATPDK